MTDPDRVVRVAYARLDGWERRFGERHGTVERSTDGVRVRLRADDGAEAAYDDVAPPEAYALVLVRRGGYAVGRVVDGRLVDSSCGTRYVQGKTKAGGWSQQRYARRRANQADDLVRAASGAIDRVLSDHVSDHRRLPTHLGGDRELAAQAWAAARLGGGAVADRWIDVPGDPRQRSLIAAIEQVAAVPITLNALA